MKLIKYVMTLHLFITNKHLGDWPAVSSLDLNCCEVLLTRVSERSSALGESTGE